MIAEKIFVVFVTFIFVFRTISVLFSKNPDVKTCIGWAFGAVILDVCCFSATKSPVFILIFAFVAVKMLHLLLKSRAFFRKNETSGVRLLTFLDQIILSMRGGLSFEGASAEISRVDGTFRDFHASGGSAAGKSFRMTNGQKETTEFARVMSFCGRHPSQSFKVLTFFRESYRRRMRLQGKYAAAALQAKAQAVIASFLYLVVLAFEWVAVPEFHGFLRSARGKLIFLVSAVMVAAGVTVIFKLGRPPELDL